MITIELQNESDAKVLCNRFSDTRAAVLKVRCEENRVLVGFKEQSSAVAFVSAVLADYVLASREEDMLLDLIRTKFYFQDKDEQEQILAITKSIIQGEKPDLPGLKSASSRKQVLLDAFSDFLEDGASFHYESFSRFRLKAYQECLQHYVEMAIDEYKLEQDYQDFVENLRRLLKYQEPLIETIHVFFQHEFALYGPEHERIDENEIYDQLDPILKRGWGLDIEPSVLLTLLGIAPKTLFLYTDNVDAGMIQTIQNVFQERVILCPARACDFHS